MVGWALEVVVGLLLGIMRRQVNNIIRAINHDIDAITGLKGPQCYRHQRSSRSTYAAGNLDSRVDQLSPRFMAEVTTNYDEYYNLRYTKYPMLT